MNNSFYFLRHGKTKVDGKVPISKWVLSEKGALQVKELVDSNVFSSIEVVICSGEEKAYQTAKPIANALGKEVLRYDDLSELNRDEGGFMSPEQYEKTIEECLTNRGQSTHRWETANSALERFSQKINELERKYDGKNVLVVGHGFTINLYFASLLGQLDSTYRRLQTNTFCDWGIVRDNSVVKDIANVPG